ncbi:LytR/AlgR family response regulator transcription factor [Puia sp. P3]|uniref:LytR/AlgR family response regulator transcription factor n=1 Tax=Puia sp. P3 TaxID=3423952 RepID=UPI003D666699
MTLSCIIVDDEPNAVSLLEMLIQQNTNWDIKAKCYDAREALAWLKTSKVDLDLIFLDINMPRLTGMEMAALLPSSTHIVFTTAYSEYAAESYSFPTIDYLLKPITLKRFYTAMQKIEAFFAKASAAEPTPAPLKEEEYFFVKSGRVLQKVLLKDILYIEGEKEYARIVTPDQRLLIYRRLKDIEDQLSASFARIHNSYIVNLSRLDAIKDNHVHIGTIQIPISEKFREAFMNRIKQRVF